MVGVNEYVVEEPEPESFQVDQAMQDGVLADLAQFKAERNDGLVQETLDHLEQVARSTDNLMPSILAAVESLATVGEICDRFELVFGKYRPGGTL